MGSWPHPSVSLNDVDSTTAPCHRLFFTINQRLEVIKDFHSTCKWDGSIFAEEERGSRDEGCHLCGLRNRRPDTMNRREADRGKTKQKQPKKKKLNVWGLCERNAERTPDEDRGSNKRWNQEQMKHFFKKRFEQLGPYPLGKKVYLTS
jgi:hypothetical protein